VTAAAGSFGSSADWPGLVLASSHLRRRHFSPLHDFCLFFRPVFLGPDLGNSECRSLRRRPRHSRLFRAPDRQV